MFHNKTSISLQSDATSLLKISSVLFGIILISSAVTSQSFADVTTPKKQQKYGLSPNEVFCKQGMFKVYKQNTGDAACVKPDSAKKMSEQGWAKKIDIKKLQVFEQNNVNRQNVGTVKKVDVIPAKEKTASQSKIMSYYYIFEACAGPETIMAPEIAIVSDSQVKYVKISQKMTANSCETNSAIINAEEPKSISAFFTNDGTVTEKITAMEDTIKELQEKIRIELRGFASDVENNLSPEVRSEKIINLRANLNDAREEMNRYLFALHVDAQKPSKLPFEMPKSFLGNPIKGILADIISISETVSKAGKYDVAFQVCTASQILRIPVAEIKSDQEIIRVKLSDKIAPNSCQVTGAKIAASDPASIQISLADSAEKSGLVSEIEREISELQNHILENKRKLSKIVHEQPKSENYDEIVGKISAEIIHTRNTINELKLDLFRILNQIYD